MLAGRAARRPRPAVRQPLSTRQEPAAALRNYALALGTDLSGQGIHAAHIAIGVLIGSGPGTEPETIAEHYWDTYTKRDQPEIIHSLPGGAW